MFANKQGQLILKVNNGQGNLTVNINDPIFKIQLFPETKVESEPHNIICTI